MAETRDIEDFYRAHAGAVLSYLISLCRDRNLAEDLMQDTFVKATRALGGYRGGSPRAWLFAIARSVFLDETRKRSRRPIPSDEVDPVARPGPDFAEQDAIEHALATLPERQRSVLVLSDRIGLTGQELAQAMGVSEGAARVLLYRARRAFRESYRQEG